MITCREAVDRLWTYLDRHLEKAEETELEEHLGVCRHCRGELEFARQLRARLRGSATAHGLGPDVESRLETFLTKLRDSI